MAEGQKELLEEAAIPAEQPGIPAEEAAEPLAEEHPKCLWLKNLFYIISTSPLSQVRLLR
jgi:hypothetical protein